VYRSSGILLYALICFENEDFDEHATYNITNHYRLKFYNEKREEMLSMEIVVERKVKL
jgi:hypothetical protein